MSNLPFAVSFTSVLVLWFSQVLQASRLFHPSRPCPPFFPLSPSCLSLGHTIWTRPTLSSLSLWCDTAWQHGEQEEAELGGFAVLHNPPFPPLCRVITETPLSACSPCSCNSSLSSLHSTSLPLPTSTNNICYFSVWFASFLTLFYPLFRPMCLPLTMFLCLQHHLNVLASLLG